jgi:hypothetical protein
MSTLITGFQYRTDADLSWTLSGTIGEVRVETEPKIRRASLSPGDFPSKIGYIRGEGKPETFDFLGFTNIIGRTGMGSLSLKRKTVASGCEPSLKNQAKTASTHS